MERKIGEIFEYQGEWYQCVKGDECKYCNLRNIMCHRDTDLFPPDECVGAYRKDNTSVIFKKLEKIGEPFTVKGKRYQRYTTHVHPYYVNELISIPLDDSSTLIEVKQNKEDMEESVEEKLFCDKVAKANTEYMKDKLNSSLKPFDLEAAKAGKPVCTRNGCKVRIICFDRNGNRPIVALIERDNHEEVLQSCYDNGRCCYDIISDHDLMMLPEKKEGWVNICRDAKDDDRIVLGSISESREEAVELAPNNDRYTTIATVRIEWEE